MNAWAVVVAAGQGARSGLAENKIFFMIDGVSMLSRTLMALHAPGVFKGIVLVVAEGDADRVRDTLEEEGTDALVDRIVYGGATRQASVARGLSAVDMSADIIAVHDAARPFVTPEIIRAVLAGAEDTGSGVISTPMTDTIKQLDADGTVHTVDRDGLRAVQTPQAFDAKKLRLYHERAALEGFQATDEAMLFERYEGTVTLVQAPGAERNKKMTVPADFAANAAPQIHTGIGYDAHRLVEGRRLILCGVDVPHEKGLDGHSDADVAVHALMDALLGAACMGDIGQHFPDNDPKYKGISSMKLLEHVVRLLDDGGWRIVNVDIVIVAQRPKLRPYIDAMQANLRAALNTQFASVKATTTERMGFEGEEIGISAQAVASIARHC